MNTELKYENGTLTVTRVFDAPREAVFEAWVETSKVQQWWGCAQTTNVSSEIEPQVGGKYYHLMTLDGVGELPMKSRIERPDSWRQRSRPDGEGAVRPSGTRRPGD